jgi:hypothetical protein
MLPGFEREVKNWEIVLIKNSTSSPIASNQFRNGTGIPEYRGLIFFYDNP